MGIALIITKSIDKRFNGMGKEIQLDEWVRFIESDPSLAMQTAPSVAGVLSVPPLPGQSTISVKGKTQPFLGYRRGTLIMKYSQTLENPDDPVRKKIAEIARRFHALIRHDAGDDFLDW